MLDRNAIIIDPSKGREFEMFLKTNAKDRDFWRRNNEAASKPIDKKKLEELFK